MHCGRVLGRIARRVGAVALAIGTAIAGAGEVQAQVSATPGGPSGGGTGTSPSSGAGRSQGSLRVPGSPITFHTANSKGGWFYLAPGIKARWVHDYPVWSGHPTVEIILAAGVSGHPTQEEKLLLQFPPNLFQIPESERAIVVAFHPYGVSYASPFNGSLLPALCEQRNWILLAPMGLNQTNFASVESQNTLDIVMALVLKILPFNRERVYTVGFSMGGLNAVSYAMRKQDPNGIRVAGVINHTGTMDVIQDYENGSSALKLILEDDEHFGGSPTEVPFAWERINPTKLTAANKVDPDRAPATNLVDLPIYLHVNTQDNQQGLVNMTYALHDYLLSLGADVFLSEVQAGSTHHWSTMDMAAALDFIDSGIAPGPAPSKGPVLELFADREDRYRLSEVLEIEPNLVANYRIVVQSPAVNAFAVQSTRAVRELALDLAPMKIDPAKVLTITTWSADFKAVTLVLRGYAKAPSTITVNGAPPTAWSYDPVTKELSIKPTANGSFAVVQVLP
ncbi:hypothetical protein [Engelhardtia mirabilis]